MKLHEQILLSSVKAQALAIESLAETAEARLTAAAKGAAKALGANRLNGDQADALAAGIARRVLLASFSGQEVPDGDLYELGAQSVREVIGGR